MKVVKRKVESGKPKRRLTRCPAHSLFPFPPSAFPFPLSPLRRGISLIEILVSIFVLLFGLMGVAAIFPVGNHYVVEGEKFDLGSSLAQNAFEELVARGMLRPEVWQYSDPNFDLGGQTETNNSPPIQYDTSFIQPSVLPGSGTFNLTGPATPFGPGHAFVLDPLGTAADSTLQNLDIFPRIENASGVVITTNPWGPSSTVPTTIFGTRWPIRRLTVLDTNGLMSTAVAETIFRLRDDLAVTQPDEDDRPSIQNWDLDTTTVPASPTLLRRQYKGDYSWLATIVPPSAESLAALQPAVATNDYGEQRYEVSVVVFRRREVAPSATSERLIQAEIVNDGELAIYASTKEQVDAAVDDISEGNWIAVAGVNQTTGDFALKWYRILSMDRETSGNTLFFAGATQARFLTIDGPDWPDDSYANLRAIILPGVISVATHPLHMEDFSLWSLE